MECVPAIMTVSKTNCFITVPGLSLKMFVKICCKLSKCTNRAQCEVDAPYCVQVIVHPLAKHHYKSLCRSIRPYLWGSEPICDNLSQAKRRSLSFVKTSSLPSVATALVHPLYVLSPRDRNHTQPSERSGGGNCHYVMQETFRYEPIKQPQSL